MWHDNDTDRDFLNFTGVAETIAEIIVQAKGQAISIGVSGAWGVGKSSMIKLTQQTLRNRERAEEDPDFVFVEFNAWLYQGYDDARSALMEVIAAKLEQEALERETAIDKAADFLNRVRWLRLGKLVAPAIASAAMGFPLPGLAGALVGLGKSAFADDASAEAVSQAKDDVKEAAGEWAGLLDPKAKMSPPKEIQALRDSFEQTLAELGVTLVVLIDDLDRCLPETTISTLEAIRLFLFLDNTAFVIAADEEMIRYAVRRHFTGVDNERLVTNYFDKLIQVPIRVPPLGTQEVRAYMMLLFVENSGLEKARKEAIRVAVSDRLRQTWQGKRVDRKFMQEVDSALPPDLLEKLDAAERLAPIMTSTEGVLGNPRLIKRFLNALSIRMAISSAQSVGVDEAVLAKLLLFERLGEAKAYAQLLAKVSESDDGKPAFLGPWEEAAKKGASPTNDPVWSSPFILEWLKLHPAFADQDLRGALYVSREHAPLITPEDRLSSAAAELLQAMLEQPEMSGDLKVRLAEIPRPEIDVMMARVLERARREQDWGTPEILEAALVLTETDPVQGPRLASFLLSRQGSQIKADIVPKIGGRDWAKPVTTAWAKSPDISKPVKTAIGHLKS